jgi:glycosyltransferase involved in cell wall biosynthesis
VGQPTIGRTSNGTDLALDGRAPRITVAVVVRDRRDRMLRCLEAILAQDHPSFEVLVLDNESVDGTSEAVREVARTAAVPVRVDVVGGSVGRLRNEAVRRARGEILAFTDSDCAPAPGWLAAGDAAMAADRRLGVVQGRTMPDVAPESLGRWPNTQRIEGFTSLYECCNIFYRTSALRGANGFDEKPRLSAFGEDTAAGWSLRRLGWREAYAPAALVHHDVTYPGLAWHLRRALRYEVFPSLVREYPELRDQLFWRRWFLAKRYAGYLLAVIGLLGALRRRPLLVLALPYVAYRRPARWDGPHLRGQIEGAMYDTAAFVGLVRGSIRSRRVVL